jgi:tetratricopeptide (TPR) repeat protein
VTRRAWLFAASLAAAAAPAFAAEPPCAAQCRDLASRGQLQEKVTVEICAERVCHEAARALYRENKFQESLDALDFIRGTRKAEASYELDRGLTLYALGRYDEAIESFDVVLRIFPNSIRAGAQRAHSLEKKGDLAEALAQFEALLTKPGVDTRFKDLDTRSYLQSSIGVLQLRQGDLPGGRQSMQRALEIDRGNRLADTYLRRVIPSLESGELEPEGLGLLQSAFEHTQLGRPDLAAREFEEVINRWPRYAPAYILLAEGLRAERRYPACEDLLVAALQQRPGDVEIRLHRIRCSLLRHGVASQAARPALEELKQIAAENPENRLARQILAAVEAP